MGPKRGELKDSKDGLRGVGRKIERHARGEVKERGRKIGTRGGSGAGKLEEETRS